MIESYKYHLYIWNESMNAYNEAKWFIPTTSELDAHKQFDSFVAVYPEKTVTLELESNYSSKTVRYHKRNK